MEKVKFINISRTAKRIENLVTWDENLTYLGVVCPMKLQCHFRINQLTYFLFRKSVFLCANIPNKNIDSFRQANIYIGSIDCL